MTVTYAIFRRWLGQRSATIAICIWYAILILAILMSIGTGNGDPILYLDDH